MSIEAETFEVTNRELMQDIFCGAMEEIGISSYGYYIDNNKEEHYGFENEVFKMIPFKWDIEDCTCGLDDIAGDIHEEKGEYEGNKYRANHWHDLDCRASEVNFLYKPTGFMIKWYKYALRDAYMSQDVSVDKFRDILDECVESVNVDMIKEPIKLISLDELKTRYN